MKLHSLIALLKRIINHKKKLGFDLYLARKSPKTTITLDVQNQKKIEFLQEVDDLKNVHFPTGKMFLAI